MFPQCEEDFIKLAEEGAIVPVYQEFYASFETPLFVYHKIREGSYSFLLESVERGVQVGRYSFIGAQPYLVFSARDGKVTIREKDEVRNYASRDPLGELEKIFKQYRVVNVPGLSGFSGGAVGYFGYDMIRYFEKLPPRKQDGDLPDCVLMFTDTVLIFDHVRQVIQVVVNVKVSDDPRSDYREALEKIEQVGRKLNRQIPEAVSGRINHNDIGKISGFDCNVTPDEFQEMVRQAKKYIKAGDIFQVVLSQRIESPLKAEPLEIYRNLRFVNPSPYMFYLEMDDLKLVGSSPEFLVKVNDREVEVRPIAGTRPRGKDEADENALEQELLADEKERAEHLMLVDLGRNDIGRVCSYGTVKVEKFMEVEKYSHVMHLVSRVKGKLAPGISNFDVLRACFPAGTVSGAPKIRAMEIIDELEPTSRGPYAGAVGYLSFSGDMDTCITIRTVIINKNKATIQVGAGIVADSDPYREYEECQNKAKAMLKAVQMAGGDKNDSGN